MGAGMQHHVTAVDSSGYAVPIGDAPVGSHLPGTYVRSVSSLLPIATPCIDKLEHKVNSDVTPSIVSASFVLQLSSLYTRNVP